MCHICVQMSCCSAGRPSEALLWMSMLLQARAAQQQTFLQDMLPDKALHGRQGLAPAFSQVVLPQLNRDRPAPRHCQKILRMLPPFQSWPVSHGTCAAG